MLGMIGNHFVRPIQDFARFAFERHDEKLHPDDFEMVPGIVMSLGVEGSPELLCLGKFFTRKIFIEVGCPVDGDVTAVLVVRLLEAHVVVSQTGSRAHAHPRWTCLSMAHSRAHRPNDISFMH